MESAAPRLRLRTQEPVKRIEPQVEEPAPEDAQAAAEEAPVATPEPEKIELDDMLRDAANAQASYTQLNFVGTVGQYYSHWCVTSLMMVFGGIFYLPLVLSRRTELFFKSIELDEARFEFSPSVGKACVYSGLAVLSGIGAWLMIAFQPLEQWIYAAGGLGAVCAVLVPFVLYEMARNRIEGLSYREVGFEFDGGKAFYVVKYLLLPAIASGVGLVLSFLAQIPMGLSVPILMSFAGIMSNREYLIKHTQFGKKRMEFQRDKHRLGQIYTVPILVGLALHAVLIGALYGLSQLGLLSGFNPFTLVSENLDTEDLMNLSVAVLIIYGYVAIEYLYLFWAHCYMGQGRRRYYIDQTSLGPIQAVCAYSGGSFFWLRFGNQMLKVISLGLLTPYAMYREDKYLIENVALVASSKKIRATCIAASDKPQN